MIIEKGLNYMEPNRLHQQNKTTNIISPSSTSSQVTVEFTTDKVLQHRPIFIKTEPIECDNSSDYSLDTGNCFNNHSITPIIAIVPNVEPNSLENINSDSKFINEFMNLNPQEENKHTVVNPLNVINKGQPSKTRKPSGVAKKSLKITKKIITGKKKIRESRTNEINYCETRRNKPQFKIVYKEKKNVKDSKKSN